MDGPFALVRDCLHSGVPVALATVVEVLESRDAPEGVPRLGAKLVIRQDAESVGTLGTPEVDRVVGLDALRALDAGRSESRHYDSQITGDVADITVFIDVFPPQRRMLIFGAVDFTAALVRVAKVLGYHVTVCDARPVFATSTRFPEADNVVVDWPDRHLAQVADRLGPQDAICVLTHDHKFDIPAIVAALDSKVGYVGAMGSRKTHGARVRLLESEGVDPKKIRMIMAPIGIDIGASTPEETAIAICAEIISLRAGVAAQFLRDGSGPIHKVAP